MAKKSLDIKSINTSSTSNIHECKLWMY